MNKVYEISLSSLMEEIGIDKASIAELLSIYCTEMSEEMQQVRKALQKQEWTSLQRTIHNIKGVSANLSLQPIFTASSELDSMLKNKNYLGIEESVQELLNVLESTIAIIQKALEQHRYDSNGLR